jgi:hypothetical protein
MRTRGYAAQLVIFDQDPHRFVNRLQLCLRNASVRTPLATCG